MRQLTKFLSLFVPFLLINEIITQEQLSLLLCDYAVVNGVTVKLTAVLIISLGQIIIEKHNKLKIKRSNSI